MLSYSYSGGTSSILTTVVDSLPNEDHLPFGVNAPATQPISLGYDGNGNALGNGVTAYNFLNLPEEMAAANAAVQQEYVSSGYKYRKIVDDQTTPDK
ncbi:MAG: hypothetical protein AAFZ63_21175 [Bacteroidota bacterium]